MAVHILFCTYILAIVTHYHVACSISNSIIICMFTRCRSVLYVYGTQLNCESEICSILFIHMFFYIELGTSELTKVT